MLSKLDLASPEQARALHLAIDAINPEAERASFPQDEAASHALTDWVLLPKQTRPTKAHSHSHSQGQLIAISFSEKAPLLADRLLALVETFRSQLYRVKGFVHVAGDPRRAFLELAGDRITLEFAEDWPVGEAKSELVMIGEDLDEASVRRQIWACRAG